MSISKLRLFTIFVVLLVTVDMFYIYICYNEFNTLYSPSVMVLGSIIFILCKELERIGVDKV